MYLRHTMHNLCYTDYILGLHGKLHSPPKLIDKEVGYLLYAYALVIISSPNALQNCLIRLIATVRTGN